MRHDRLLPFVTFVSLVACDSGGSEPPAVEDKKEVPELTAVDRCVGSRFACESVTDEAACEANGCSWGHCSGGTTDCWEVTNAGGDLELCEQLSDYCQIAGMPYQPTWRACYNREDLSGSIPCSALNDVDNGSCGRGSVCRRSVEPACSGELTPCEELDVAACGDAPGCRVETQREAACTGNCQCPAGSSRCGDLCVDTSSSSLHCGSCDAACPGTRTCVDGQCAIGDTIACVDGGSDVVACGPNQRGEQRRTCVAGSWKLGPCVDADECADGKLAPDQSCGINGRGARKTHCNAGRWFTEDCVDPDVCTDGDHVIACGAFGTGTATRTCAQGHWAGTTPCDDPAEHHEVGPTVQKQIPSGLTSHDGSLYYLLSNTSSEGEVWRSQDGAAAQRLVEPGTSFTRATGLVSSDLGLFFVAEDDTYGAALWKSDGTAPGTSRILGQEHWTRLMGFSASLSMGKGGRRVYFTGMAPNEARDPWVSDGTTTGTYKLADLFGTGEVQQRNRPSGFTEAGDRVYFMAQGREQTLGAALWSADPRVANSAVPIAGPGSKFPHWGRVTGFGVVGDVTFFTREASGRLYRATDGGAHIEELNDYERWGSDHERFTRLGDGLLFIADETTTSYVKRGIYRVAADSTFPELWDAGFERLGTLYVAGDAVYSFGTKGNEQQALWRTDGKPGGARMLGSFPGTLGDVTVHGNLLFFTYDDGAHGAELWVSDGTVAGTHLVNDLLPGSAGSKPQELTAVGDYLYYVVDLMPEGTLHDQRLWCTRVRRSGSP